MRRIWGITLGAAACLALTACSPSGDAQKNAKPAAKADVVPAVYNVVLDTSKGPVTIEVHRDWAPHGADHFYTLVKTGFYDGARFFRVVRDFVVQFGISGDPAKDRLWANANILDDPVQESNVKGAVSYAKEGPNTRSTQLFINLKDNGRLLDKTGFAPIGRITSGMDVVESLYKFYGEMAPRGQGPDATKILTEGNAYLDGKFPRLDYIKKATIQ